MADKPRVSKPRVKAPKQRTAPNPRATAERRRLLLYGGGVLAALAAAGVIVALLGLASGSPSAADVRTDLQAAGCTLQAVEAQPGRHSLPPDGKAKWNTDPPTSGPHFGFNPDGSVGTVVWGAYTEPVQLARVVHNLEHGGVYIFYGDDVADSVVQQLQAFYDDHKNGTVLAPYPKLGKQIALGAWVAGGTGSGTGYLAKCKAFDEGAFSSFFKAFQFKGPEPHSSDSLLPGGL
jgi:Protein of unknown function (DUF3105)